MYVVSPKACLCCQKFRAVISVFLCDIRNIHAPGTHTAVTLHGTRQVEACLAAVIPDECWEKTQGAPTCSSTHSGTFLVQDKRLHLHVGPDVENALSCMIEADGLLMGCSTFGQLAGLLSEGIKFFSVSCQGWKTGYHYQMVPPMVRSVFCEICAVAGLRVCTFC